MDLRRRISYQWQLFIPLVTTLWIVIFGMTYWQFYNERQYRLQHINAQLELVNKRIIAAYETDFNYIQFIDFVCRYYRENPLYDLLRVSVYVDNKLIRSWGDTIALPPDELDEQGITHTSLTSNKSDNYFFYRVEQSTDKRFAVCTLLPFDNDILSASLPSYSIFWIMFALGCIMTAISYISTRYFSRNINILRSFAKKAATDNGFVPAVDFPQDELGDINRQIVRLYNQRSQAMLEQKREHEVAIHAIEEKAQAKRQLTNNINHELRTPIGVIKGYIDTIINDHDMDNDSRNHFLKKAQQHVERLANLVSDVAILTRLEDGGELVATEPLNFHDLVYTVANELNETGALNDLSFTFDIPLDCTVIGNYNILSGMINNLFRNAAAYSKGTLCELLTLNADNRFFYFEFRDNGIGVDEKHLPHLFERFYRIDSGRSRKDGGSGLGLPIVRNSIIVLGGNITVENGITGGLAFKFSLLRAKPRI